MCIQQKPLCIIGTLPDTAGIGGVTRHVERLLQALDNRGVSYRFVDYKKESIRYILRIITCSKVIHLHCSNKKFQFLCIFGLFYVTRSRFLQYIVILRIINLLINFFSGYLFFLHRVLLRLIRVAMKSVKK